MKIDNIVKTKATQAKLKTKNGYQCVTIICITSNSIILKDINNKRIVIPIEGHDKILRIQKKKIDHSSYAETPEKQTFKYIFRDKDVFIYSINQRQVKRRKETIDEIHFFYEMEHELEIGSQAHECCLINDDTYLMIKFLNMVQAHQNGLIGDWNLKNIEVA